MNNNNLISKLQLLFYVCIENNIPILARDGFLLGTIRHNGFMNYDIDPDIMICETDKSKLDSLKKVSNNFFTVKYHKKYDDVFYIYNDNQVIGEGVILVYHKDNNMLQQGKNFYGGDREEKRFYSVYGHSESEEAVYKYSFDDVYPLSKCLFYEKEIFVPKNSIKLLKEHYGDDVMTHYFDKLEKNIIKKPLDDTVKLNVEQNEIDKLYIYYKMIIYSGPHTNHINNNNTIRDNIELYSSFHLPKFTYTNALRNVLIQFKKYQIEDFAGKRVLDIGCNIGSVIFECYNRNASYIKGIEFNKNRVNICNDLAKYLNVEDKCSFECVDINFLLSDDKLINKFIRENDNFDIVICKSVDAYINDKEKLYKLVSNLTKEKCYFEINSDITEHNFKLDMKKFGFNIESLGTILSDKKIKNIKSTLNKNIKSTLNKNITNVSGKKLLLLKKNLKKDLKKVNLVGNNRKSFILEKFNSKINTRKNTIYDVSIKKDNNNFIYSYNNIEHFNKICSLLNKIKEEKFIPNVIFGNNFYTLPELKNQLCNSFFNKEELIDIKNQIIDMIKILNKKNISHRDIHTKNLFYDDNILYLIDYDFLTEEYSNISKCYDLTGRNLESPLRSKNMNIFHEHRNSVKSFLKPIEIKLEDFL